MHSLGERHDARLPRRAFRKPAEHLLLDERGKALFQRLDPRTGFLCFISFAPTIQRWHIPPIKRSERTPYLTTRRPTCTLGADDLEPFGKRLLALPNVYGIEERRVRLGVERTWTTSNDERVIFCAIDSMKRQTCQIERLEHVGRRKLMRKRDADDVKSAKRSAALDREQRQPFPTQCITHVGRGQKTTLCHHTIACVNSIHENAQRLVCLAQLVGIGIHHAEAKAGFGLVDAPPLMVDIARRSLCLRDERRYLGPDTLEWNHV